MICGSAPTVAPLAGAWIEIAPSRTCRRTASVAPLAGAWIEIQRMDHWTPSAVLSLPSRERGLKYVEADGLRIKGMSLPSRERGLKSPPHGEKRPRGKSLPSRERGLKSIKPLPYRAELPVAPLAGAWIEIAHGLIRTKSCIPVAPLAGAWIEIFRGGQEL